MFRFASTSISIAACNDWFSYCGGGPKLAQDLAAVRDWRGPKAVLLDDRDVI